MHEILNLQMQRAEMEELRQREANLTALQAIGPRKKPKLEAGGMAGCSGQVCYITQLLVAWSWLLGYPIVCSWYI
jgi:hypothetical protein